MRVVGRRRESGPEFAKAHGTEDLMVIARDSVEAAVRQADIVVTITKATEPFVEPGWLAPGAVLLSMGGCPEVAFEVLDETDRLIVDDLDYALAQGDLHAWVEAGRIDAASIKARIDADIGQVAVGDQPGRTDADQRILAVIQGMAICDLAMAKMVLDRANLEDVGQVVEL